MKQKRMEIGALALLLVGLQGCSAKHITAFSPEYYYLPEEAMRLAKVTKQIDTIYVASDESSYSSVGELKSKVEAQPTKAILECNYKENACSEYNLAQGDTQTGLVKYNYRYDTGNTYIISKVSEDTFREFSYDGGRLNKIKDYAGTNNTVDAPVLAERNMVYKDEVCDGADVSRVDIDGNPISYRYRFEYDEKGVLTAINTIDEEEVITAKILLAYNDKNLVESMTFISYIEGKEHIVSYHEYTYD
ncbi:MAG: hypothetical protein IJ875_04785 [Solobacterium sp.]|nr:hypothetical protein [Solobacterium sp.]